MVAVGPQRTDGAALPPGGPAANVVAALYQAAVDPLLWPVALDATAAFVGSSGALLCWLNERREVLRSAQIRLPERLVEDYAGRVIHDCPRLAHALRQPEGSVLCDHQHISEAEMERSGYYQWLEESGAGSRYYLGCRLGGDGQPTAFLLLTFRRREGPAQGAQTTRFTALIPHLRQAIGIEQRLNRSSTRADACAQVLVRLHLPVAVLDTAGRLVVASAAFEEATSQCGRCVTVRDGTVQAAPAYRRAFERMRHGTCATEYRTSATAALDVTWDGHACTVNLASLSLADNSGNREAYAALYLVGRCSHASATAADVRNRFGFTAAEARLATALIAGKDLEAACHTQAISIATGRSHLHAMFAKTHTHRQTDLLRVLLSAPL